MTARGGGGGATIISRAGGSEDGEGGDACVAVAPRPPLSPSSDEDGEVELSRRRNFPQGARQWQV